PPRAVEELQLVPFEAVRQPGGDAEDEQGDHGQPRGHPNRRQLIMALRSHVPLWHKAAVHVPPGSPAARRRHRVDPAVIGLGAATPILLAAVVRRVRDERAAVLAALLAALYVPAIFYEALLVKFSVVPFVTSVLLYATVRLREGTRRWALAAGVALAALALLRPNTVLLAPVVGWAAVRGVRPSLAARRMAFIATGVALLMVPMAVRDHLAAERGVASA